MTLRVAFAARPVTLSVPALMLMLLLKVLAPARRRVPAVVLLALVALIWPTFLRVPLWRLRLVMGLEAVPRLCDCMSSVPPAMVTLAVPPPPRMSTAGETVPPLTLRVPLAVPMPLPVVVSAMMKELLTTREPPLTLRMPLAGAAVAAVPLMAMERALTLTVPLLKVKVPLEGAVLLAPLPMAILRFSNRASTVPPVRSITPVALVPLLLV